MFFHRSPALTSRQVLSVANSDNHAPERTGHGVAVGNRCFPRVRVLSFGALGETKMKAAFILFAFVLFTSTSFARMRSILVEVTVPNDGVPTVSIYSAYENEQCVCVSIAEASKVLYRVRQPGNMLDVSVLINGWIKNELLW